MGCGCSRKRTALTQAVKTRDMRRAVAAAKSGLREMLTGVDDGAVPDVASPAEVKPDE